MQTRPQDLFPTTHWSLVEQAGDADTRVRNGALERLITRYERPLRLHMTLRLRIPAQEADDLLQGFLVSRVLERDLIERADPQRGRFRNYLLKALERFIANERRARQSVQRAPLHRKMVSFNVAPEPIEPGGGPVETFDADWARQVLQWALLRMFDDCERGNQKNVWGIFEARVLASTLLGPEPLTYEELVARYALTSKQQACNLLVTGKRMFVRALRSVVGEYEKNDADIDAEIADLWSALSIGSPFCLSDDA